MSNGYEQIIMRTMDAHEMTNDFLEFAEKAMSIAGVDISGEATRELMATMILTIREQQKTINALVEAIGLADDAIFGDGDSRENHVL